MEHGSDQSFIMAARLKQLREEKGLSHDKLGKALSEQYGVKISPDSLMNYEVANRHHSKAGKNQGMRIEYLRCFTDFYEVSADYLLGSTDIRTPSADTQAIISKTGLSESNARLLEALQAVPMTASIEMANELLALVLNSDIIIQYLLMRATLNVPPPISWHDRLDDGSISLEEMASLESEQRKNGYVQLTGKEAFEYHCAKIAGHIEQALIDKYKGSAKWGASDGND